MHTHTYIDYLLHMCDGRRCQYQCEIAHLYWREEKRGEKREEEGGGVNLVEILKELRIWKG
jgi:hypothetical protein